MKAALFVTAGLGDAVMLLPLIKALKQAGRHVTVIFQSRFVSQELLEDTGLVDDMVSLPTSWTSLSLWSLQHFRAFDEVYLNHLAASPANLLAARVIGRRVITCLKGKRRWLLKGANHTLRQPLPSVHDAIQNLRLWDSTTTSAPVEAFMFPPSALQKRFAKALAHQLKKPYIVIQVSAANSTLQYKNWPIAHWIEWLKQASAHYPDYSWVLLGDPSERALAQKIVAEGIPNVVSVAGETSLQEVMQIIYGAELLVGLDSGLMHVAVAFGKPTFTLWGGSNPQLYGYEWLDSIRHRCQTANLPCSPCNAWIEPNISRVTDPLKCPDFACMLALQPNTVFKHFQKFFVGVFTTDK